jgi:hypothetical protein
MNQYSYDYLEPHSKFDLDKEALIQSTIKDVCHSIWIKGLKSHYSEIYDMIYNHVEDNLDMTKEEADYD